MVIGGGVAGVCAAIQSARLGASTALIERELVLGGNSASHFKLHIEGCHHYHPWGRETGIVEELEAEAAWRGAYIEPSGGMSGYFNSQWSEILLEACEAAGVTVYLKTLALEPDMRNGRIVAVHAQDMLRHQRVRLAVGSVVIDASGDGDLAAAAGASYRMGREAAGEFGERFAPEVADNRMMGHALQFMMRDTGRPVKFVPPPGTPIYETDDDLPMYRHGAWDPNAPMPIIWQAQYGGALDTVHDDREIYRHLLRMVYGLVDHLKNRSDHGAENYELYWISETIGKRESRRFLGDHVLCEPEIFRPERFPDRVAYGGRAVDLHETTDDGMQCRVMFYDTPPLYSIPFRCLYSRDVANLMFAGRNISGTRVALGSYRVMKTLATTGQAAGAGAALCARYRMDPRTVGQDHIAELQQTLLRKDATILDLANEDEHDLARGATVTASSETERGAAAQVIDGIHRQFAESPTHQWVSDPAMPQWIELDLGESRQVGQVRITFDTDLDSNRGRAYPQRVSPRTVRDYRILAEDSGGWRELAAVSGNYQRLRVHDFEPVSTRRIRVQADAANGPGEPARIYEVRVYGPR